MALTNLITAERLAHWTKYVNCVDCHEKVKPEHSLVNSSHCAWKTAAYLPSFNHRLPGKESSRAGAREQP